MTSQSLTKVSQSDINWRLQQTPIAIVGMASVFPQAKDLRQYWEKIISKADCITEVPPSRWKIEDYYDPDPKAPDKTYCKRGGFIPDIDFNPIEFGLPPNLLEVTDISQLLSLVIAKQALEDAGYGQSREFNRERTGVILGTAVGRQLSGPLGCRLQYPTWEKVLKSSGLCDRDTQKIIEKIKLAYVEWEENSFPGMLANIVAGRIANRLDLGGTNCAIDAACASSLAALKMAVSELLEHRADMMITGGVDTDNSPFTYLCFSKTPALSRKQQIRPFDIDADGMMVGEGIGMLVLKRLEDAERDKDRIYAVIKGIGSASDGRYKSIYAPRVEGQVKALRCAYEEAGFAPASVGLVEAHGTGTMAGDPTEFAALKEVFGQGSGRAQQVALGSVKSQIGHTKAAAGAASLIKTALALHHKILPPTINITKPNPKLKIEASPFYLNTETRPWIRKQDNIPRRAGVSSFGFGGTNFHVVLEEYGGEPQSAYRLHSTPQPILVVAATPQQLLTQCEHILQQLQSDRAEEYYIKLTQESQSVEPPLNAARIGFVAASVQEAKQKLQTAFKLLSQHYQSSWEHPQGIYYRPAGLDLTGKVVALFSGQGSQYLNMGRELANNFPCLRQAYSYVDSLLTKDSLKPISQVLFPASVFEPEQQEAQRRQLQRTEYAQPAIGAWSFGLYKLLQQAGFKPDFVAGHSFGELTALWAAEVLSDEDYLFLVKARGQAMAVPADPNFDGGTMMAVMGEIRKIEPLIQQFPKIKIANFNSSKQVVVAGATTEIAKLKQTLTQHGYDPVLLPVGAAFHTSLVGHAQIPFARAVEAATFRQPKIPIYTNVTGQLYPAQPPAIQKILKEHLLNQVQFKKQIENIYAAGGYCFIEFGPRSILTNLVKDILGDSPHLAVALNASRQQDSHRQLQEAVLKLRIAGLSLGNLDLHQIQPAPPENSAKPQMVFRLNASNYVSEKTKMAFEQALQDKHQIKLAATQSEPLVTTNTTAAPKEKAIAPQAVPQNMAKETVTLATGSSIPQSEVASPLMPVTDNQTVSDISNPIETELISVLPMNYQSALEALEQSLVQFNQHQQETLNVHGQYLNHQLEYSKIFFQLMQQQNYLLSQDNSAGNGDAESKSAILASLERNMMRFHDHQAATLSVHQESLHHQSEYAKNFVQLTQQKCNLLLSRQPTDFELKPKLELTNISSVEDDAANGTTDQIVSSVPETNHNGSAPVWQSTSTEPKPTPPSVVSNGVKPLQSGVNEPTELVQTPAPVTSELLNGNGNQPSPELVAAPTQTESPVTNTTAPVISNPEPLAKQKAPTQPTEQPDENRIDFSIVSQTLLEVVSQKTGYPAEMLELEMDMEADLGIDSIKRVEILGAMQEKFPEAPPVNPEELGELRTLGQIIDYMQTLTAPKPQESRLLEPEIADRSNGNEIKTQEIAAVPDKKYQLESNGNLTVSVPDPASISNNMDFGIVSQTLLEVVSQKTGYPAEMLELEMDMEADLGIDSIKRVEILGAMQEQFPEAPPVNPEELGELRTLGQIIDYMQTLTAPKPQEARLLEPEIADRSNGNEIKTQEIAAVPEQNYQLESNGNLTVSVPEPSSISNNMDFGIVSQTLLEVVSQKTGYPAEMLELEMDMEADLGIDSIKRVEILGAMQEKFPEAPPVNPEELGELRTLGQIIDYMQTLAAQKKTLNPSLARENLV